ncbi:NAD(P)-dependent dehydrogenase (short-subunit alcohol dehydrogenase family) [Thermocatellispora tengchongensis]|uniref:NAD(P)-dependent dehydrogenase (Short-subunit alcohol dehydrogenase family) n=1 Tax=Thermocatellispora tengchongensis TaxID=1073253 RepID=A0A840NYY4_9ACTN|nr:SDR family oxidoreductase [Thermocatellispora tengchongensis]MBB5130871.1 NAD(P)-dependent dehydrogenase (short-subunit alcohol dehydrogenase family) [Thermocatellispora tengchongensis]
MPRRALVTGAARGIGAAVAAALAARGDVVAVHYRTDPGRAAEVAAALPGAGHVALQADLTDPDQVWALVADAVAALGGVDVLVVNAGIYGDHPIATTSYADWQAQWTAILQTNLVAAANLAWCVTRHLLDRPEGPRGGRMVMVGSRGAYRGEPRVPAYGASKAGLHALAQSLAVELAPHGIAVAAVAPGYVATEMVADVMASPEGETIRAQSPFGRVAEPEEIAGAVAWLTSPEAEWASGTVLDLNGASYLR